MRSSKVVGLLVACSAIALPGQALGDSTAVTSGKKIVEYGWDVPSPAYIADHIREMEKRPFDGVLFRLEATGNVFEPTPLDEAPLAKDFAAINRIRWGRIASTNRSDRSVQ